MDMKRRKKSLRSLRGELDRFDARLIGLLRRRFALVLKVAKVKRQGGVPVLQRAEISRRVDRACRAAGCNGMPKAFARKLMRLIIEESMRLQGS